MKLTAKGTESTPECNRGISIQTLKEVSAQSLCIDFEN